MEEYKIVYHHDVVSRDIPDLDKITSLRIKKSIENKLRISPEVFGIPLRATLKQYWKLRIGDYRVVYKISGSKIYILIISHRKNVYELANKRI